MPNPAAKPRFPIVTTLVLLTLIALVVGWLLTLLMPMFFAPPTASLQTELHRIIYLSTGIVWLAAMLSLLPLFMLAPRGLMPTVTGYFIGSGVRLLLCLGAAVYLCLFNQQPALPTGLAMVAVYVPLLFVESALVGRYLIQLDKSPKPKGDKSTDPANNQSLKETQA